VHIALRILRIGGVAAGLAYLFHLSRQAGLQRGNEELPGMLWAIGVLSLLFFIRALLTETTQPDGSVVQRDVLWGLTAGGIVTILLRSGALKIIGG
jgi:hypothetical protein